LLLLLHAPRPKITATRTSRGADPGADRRTLTAACQCPNWRTGGGTNPGAAAPVAVPR